jgi:hypothetical protein
MKQVSIKKNNIVTNQAKFATQELADAFLAREIANKSFGKNERELTEEQAIMEGSDIENAASSRVVETIDGEVTLYTFAADYTVEVEDITAQALAQQESEQALQYLKDTDYYIIRELDAGTACPQEIKTLRAAARLKVL